MDSFDIIFAFFMLLFPAIFMTLIGFNPKADTNRGRARRLTLLLWLATALAIGVWLIVFLMSPALARFGWLLVFPLFFGFWSPLMRAKNPDWVSTPPPDLPARSASLMMRRRQPAIPKWTIHSMWLLWLCALAVIVLLLDFNILASADPELRSRRNLGWLVLVMMAGMVLLPALMTWCLRTMWTEPQPLDPHHSPELVALYAQRNRQRAWFFIALTWAMLLLFAGTYSAMALISRGTLPEFEAGPMIGIIGGTIGSLIGIAGGIFGLMSSRQQAHINARLRELSQ